MADSKKPKQPADKPVKATRLKLNSTKNSNQSVRQKTKAASNASEQNYSRHLKTAGTNVSRPITKLFKIVLKLLKPLSFLLIPFKTKPARFLGRLLANILLLKYFRDSWKELRQVSWPDRKETTRLTLAVIIFAFFFGLIIAVTDYGLDKVFKKLIIK